MRDPRGAPYTGTSAIGKTIRARAAAGEPAQRHGIDEIGDSEEAPAIAQGLPQYHT